MSQARFKSGDYLILLQEDENDQPASLWRGGIEIRLRTPRSRLLACLLLKQGRAHQMDILKYVWNRKTPKDPEGSVRQLVERLQEFLDPTDLNKHIKKDIGTGFYVLNYVEEPHSSGEERLQKPSTPGSVPVDKAEAPDRSATWWGTISSQLVTAQKYRRNSGLVILLIFAAIEPGSGIDIRPGNSGSIVNAEIETAPIPAPATNLGISFPHSTLSVGTAAGVPGAFVDLPVAFQPPAVNEVCGVGFELRLPPELSGASVSQGPSALLSNQSVGGRSGNRGATEKVVIGGLSFTVLTSGIVAIVHLKISANSPPGRKKIGIGDISSSTCDGLAAPPVDGVSGEIDIQERRPAGK